MIELLQLTLIVELLPGLPAGKDSWGELARAAGVPFATWEWIAAWWERFGAGREQRILGCWDGAGNLIGVLPLYFASRRPLRVLRFIGNGPADQLGPICLPEHRPAVARAFAAALAEADDWDICMAERLGADDGWPDLLDGVVTRRESSPTVRIGTSDWEEFLAAKSSGFRSQVRRYERKLAREHELRFRLAEDAERIGADMDAFLRLHAERWASGTTTAFAGELSAFHRDFAARALDGGFLRLYFLELDGEPRAALYCFRLGGKDWYYQAGRDPRDERLRLGTVLLNHALREAVQGGMSEFKLLTGEHAYKWRLANDDSPVVTLGLTSNRGLRAALSGATRARRASRELRARVRRQQHAH